AGDDLATAERPHGRRVRLVAVPPAAVAKETTAAPAKETRREDITTYAPVQRIPFEDDLVEGGVPSPGGDIIVSPAPAIHSSLIEIRQHFVPEMIKSLEEY